MSRHFAHVLAITTSCAKGSGGFVFSLAFFFPSLHVGTNVCRAGHGQHFGYASMSASRPWKTFIDGVLADLGASANYRAKAKADIEAMIERGYFKHIQLAWFVGLLSRE